jgi:hypothetical protein
MSIATFLKGIEKSGGNTFKISSLTMYFLGKAYSAALCKNFFLDQGRV